MSERTLGTPRLPLLPGRAKPMYEENADLRSMGRMVDQACADVRRSESVGPAFTLGAVAACLPLGLVLLVVSIQLVWP